jgi:hypothetical protein
MYIHPTLHQELARAQHVQTLHEARSAQLLAHAAAEREPSAVAEEARSFAARLLGRLTSLRTPRPAARLNNP